MTSRPSFAVPFIGILLVACSGESGVAVPKVPSKIDEVLVEQKIREATAAVREQPDSADRWGRLGVVYDIHRFFDQALDCYETASRLDPQEWRWPYFSGIVLRETHQGAALDRFTRAAELKPDHPPLQLYLGFTHFLEENVDAAETHYTRALELDPFSINARIGLARVALAEQDADRALEILQQAASISPQEAAVHHHLSHVHSVRGDESAAELERRLAETVAIKMQPGEMASFPDPPRDEVILQEGVSSNWLLANANRALAAGRPQEAQQALEKLLKANPESIPGLIASARMFLGAGDAQRATAMIQRAVTLAPGDASVHADLGMILARTNQFPEAVEAYRRALELDPDLPEVQSNLGSLLFQMGQTDAGLEMARRAGARFPGRSDVQHNLANLLLIDGQPSEAVNVFAFALRLDPGNVEMYAGMAIALWELQRYADAIDAYRKAHRLNPSNPTTTRDLAWALSVCPQADLRDGATSLQLAQQLNEGTQFSDPRYLDLLAVAQAESGDFTKAVATLDSAMKIVRDTMARIAQQLSPPQREQMMLFAEGLRQRHELFRSGRPYREGS